jgi:hypothetical protein
MFIDLKIVCFQVCISIFVGSFRKLACSDNLLKSQGEEKVQFFYNFPENVKNEHIYDLHMPSPTVRPLRFFVFFGE